MPIRANRLIGGKECSMTEYHLDRPDLATTYDELSDSQFAKGSELVEALEIEPKHVVLDIGAGTGRLGRKVLGTKLDPGGKLIGIDPLPERIKVANAKNDFANGHYQVGSAEDLGFQPDASVDVVYLSSVFHWVQDKKKALNEIHRVLKPKGKIGITTGAKELAETTPIRQILKRILSAPKYDGLVDPDATVSTRQGTTSTELIKLLTEGGFELERLQVRRNVIRHRNAAVYVSFSEASSFGNYLAHVPEDLRPEVRAAYVKALEALDDGHGIEGVTFGISAIARKNDELATLLAKLLGHAAGKSANRARG